MSSCKVAVIISGTGSNLRALHQASKQFHICAVLCNEPKALGLKYAKENQIPAYCFARSDYSSLSLQKLALFEKLELIQPDLICLAGYMQIIEKESLTRWHDQILNIHPSLLPKFPGLHTHRRALEEGETEHGASVHFVDAEVDAGPVVAQSYCSVASSDTVEILQKKVQQLEHQLYPWCVNQYALGKFCRQAESVQWLSKPDSIPSGVSILS